MVFPTNYLEKKERIHRVEDLMRQGDWRAVLNIFQVTTYTVKVTVSRDFLPQFFTILTSLWAPFLHGVHFATKVIACANKLLYTSKVHRKNGGGVKIL